MLISAVFSHSPPYLVNCARRAPWGLPRVWLAKTATLLRHTDHWSCLLAFRSGTCILSSLGLGLCFSLQRWFELYVNRPADRIFLRWQSFDLWIIGEALEWVSYWTVVLLCFVQGCLAGHLGPGGRKVDTQVERQWQTQVPMWRSIPALFHWGSYSNHSSIISESWPAENYMLNIA